MSRRWRDPAFKCFFIVVAGLLAACLFATPTLAACCACAMKETPSEKICLTDPSTKCPEMVTKFVSTNKAFENVACDPTPLDETTACQPISSGKSSAKCAVGPTAASAYQPKQTLSVSAMPTGAIPLTSPTLNVPIP
ncbi:MAG: hypothetical protein AAB879_03085, partial [Patescibacteria group bacterium]